MKTTERPYQEMMINSKYLEVPRRTYQRELNPLRVQKIASEFDEHIANEPKVSLRAGHYYVFDGQHTIAARKFRNGGNDLPIRCKVYRGMTEGEEALLFAQQTGASAILGAGAKVRALIFGGDPEAIHFMKDTESVGIRLDYGQQRGKARIGCIATALGEYRKVGPERYKEALRLIMEAWNGCPDSMRAETILGVTRFVDLYHEEYDPKRMVKQMKKSDPVKIFRDGHAMCCNMPGYKKYLYQVFDIYNGKSKKYALPMKF